MNLYCIKYKKVTENSTSIRLKQKYGFYCLSKKIKKEELFYLLKM